MVERELVELYGGDIHSSRTFRFRRVMLSRSSSENRVTVI
jgi:hypothetical protein